jgi:hypothetical protein
LAVSVAADPPDPAAKKPAPSVEAKTKPGAATKANPKPAPKADPKAKAKAAAAVPDPRATSLFRSAVNLEKSGKKPGAIGLYRDVLIRYPGSPEAQLAAERVKALGGKLPEPSEIRPAPPPEEAKFTRAPKPKYASQDANRAALEQSLGGMINNAATPPAAGGGSYGGQAPYAP